MVDLDMIRDLLTLRYHLGESSTLPRLNWTAFIEYDGIAPLVPRLLEGVTKKIINAYAPSKVGVGISGGVDSTTVLSVLRKCFPNLEINSYCVTFGDDVREAKDAEHVADLYSTNHKHVRIENPFKDLENQIRIVDEPRWNLYPYFLFKEASKECDILLTGDGGDELFGGYVFRYNHVLHNKNESVVQRYLEAHNRDWVPDQDKLFTFPFNWNDIYSLLEPYFDNPLPLLGKVLLADYNGKLLYDFAPTNDALAESLGLNVVAPMLEPEILHMATHIPYYLKYDEKNNIGKVIMRQILLENSGYRPAIKEKIGWSMDIIEMWDKHVKDMCLDLFDSPRFVELGIINKDWIPKGFKKAGEHDPRYVSKMLGLLALELWLKVKGL